MQDDATAREDEASEGRSSTRRRWREPEDGSATNGVGARAHGVRAGAIGAIARETNANYCNASAMERLLVAGEPNVTYFWHCIGIYRELAIDQSRAAAVGVVGCSA